MPQNLGANDQRRVVQRWRNSKRIDDLSGGSPNDPGTKANNCPCGILGLKYLLDSAVKADNRSVTSTTGTPTNLTSEGKITCYNHESSNPGLAKSQACIAAADLLFYQTDKYFGQRLEFSNSAPADSPQHLPASFYQLNACKVWVDLQPPDAVDAADWEEIHHAAFGVAADCAHKAEPYYTGGEVMLGEEQRIRVRVGYMKATPSLTPYAGALKSTE
ncbi:uncharacterized protein KY384_007302 [Bacidia gigantensis]|uniref:uncharacterized protein n=1 Tax=Bacidia gigantensis TaxID=2732470 RepID=UPI001D053BC0|nr:uncharacterized protein KY384_007302 [Bacidia gigantensis]KAG8528384.1 hypothetical protein KY384_007302 [Bacidia gigantensis]